MSETKEKDSKELENFVWDNPNGLRFVSDEMLEACNLLYEKSAYEVKFIQYMKEVVSKNTGKVVKKPCIKLEMSNCIRSLCNMKDNVHDLLKALKSEDLKFEDGRSVITPKENTFTRVICSPDKKYPNYQIEEICTGCRYEKCPKYVLAYITYLHQYNMYDEKIMDRMDYRLNNNVNPHFSFEWHPGEVLKYVPDSVFNYSNELVNKGLIFVNPGLDKNGSVRIYCGQTCKQISDCNNDNDQIDNNSYNQIDNNNIGFDNYGNWISISRAIEKPLYLCASYLCRLGGCPILVAGIIYYYRKLNKDDIITELRDYYHAHQEEQDLMIKEKIDETMEHISETIQESYKDIYAYSDRIEGINELVDLLANKNQKNLHIAITGDVGVGKIKFANKIAEVLNNIGKTTEEQPIIERLSQFTYHTVSSEDGDVKGRLWFYSVEYSPNEEKRLYILTDVDEFLSDYNLHMCEKSTGSYSETKRKQFKYTIDLLTNMSSNSYFILIGSQDDINKLLELSVKLKYTFQNNIYHLPNMSIEEMLREYFSLLKPDLVNEYRNNEEKYKKQFIDFVSLNEEQLPYSNSELASYLAAYSNNKNSIVFPPDVYNKKTIDESLSGIIGLNQIKKRIKEFEKYMLYRVKAKNLGLSLASSNMHMIFEGNPGTGKTTIARIMAQMLYDMGIVKENKLIEVERKDLVANYIGQTATKTTEVIEKARNGVLFIDEAYELASNKKGTDFGSEAVTTLIKAMEDHKDELVVIFAGYTKEMHDFLNVNPGIASRIGYTFTFEDYSPDELYQIFVAKMQKMGFTLDGIDTDILNICDYYSKRKNFGNGRFVDKLIQETIMKHSQNCGDNISVIVKEDIPTLEELANYSNDDIPADEMLEKIVGMNNIKEKIKEFESYIKFVKEARERNIKMPAQNMHMIFTGNPGTGKTTIARIMAQMLYSVGIIHENKLIEVESKDLIAQYIGQTAPKTAEVIERAMGGVLFIDEAYTLCNLKGSGSDFGADAIGTLIKAMEDHKDEFVVIFAGYKDEMKEFVEINPGIASRIGYTFHFDDYSADELEQIFYIKLSSMGMQIIDTAKEKINALMKYFYSVENIGNGRFVDRVLQECIIRHSKNVVQEGEITEERIITMTEQDVPEVMEMAKLLINGDEMPDLSRITEASIKKTAYHELGHAFIGHTLFEKSGIKVLTINAEGAGTLGYVQYDVSNDGLTTSKDKFEKQICRLLGGMASEQVFMGHYESGNYSDLEKATSIARRMIANYGMSDLGLAQIRKPSGELDYEVQKEINKILDNCFKKSIEILENNKELMNNAVKYVLEKREVTGEELEVLFNNNGIYVTNE